MRKKLGKRRVTAVKALGIIAAAAIALAGCGRDGVDIPSEAVVRLSDQFTGDFALVDEDGDAVTDEDFRGKVSVIYFGFATCPDVCPLALGTLTAALNELSASELRELVPLFITVDPERDTPEALKSYLAFDERLTGLTGAPDAAEQARGAFKVYAARRPLPESALGYTMDHTSLFYIVDREGRPTLAVHDTVTPQELAEILRRSIRGRLT